MKNKILGILFGGLLAFTLIAVPIVYAVSENANENATTNGNSTTAAEKKTLAAETRVLIKTQAQELAQLREELKEKIALKRTELNQYREQEELTEQQREQIREMTQDMEQLQVKLGAAYANAIQAMQSYKGDTSEEKLTGLDLVAASQQQRIIYLQEAIDLLD